MPLTTVIGSYKSGKTAFLEDVYKHSNHLTYVRQGHKVRPDVRVCDIPNFDPSSLPFWNLYKDNGLARTVLVGGRLGGKYLPGLTGGQRKLVMLEMLYQHTLSQSRLSIALDEPIEMVSADDLTFVIDRLNCMSQKHHLLIATCDHIEALAEAADIVLGVSPFEPDRVLMNNKEYVDRERSILALSVFDARAKHHIDDDDECNYAEVPLGDDYEPNPIEAQPMEYEYDEPKGCLCK